MGIFKIIGSILVVLSTAVAGVQINTEMKKSVRLTEGFIKGLSFLKDEMGFSLEYLEESLRKSAPFSGKASDFFLITADNLRNGYVLCEAWEMQLNEMKDLHSTAKQQLIELGEILGKTDAETQKKRIESCIQSLEAVCAEQKELQQTKGVLYQKCGVVAGVLIIILLF